MHIPINANSVQRSVQLKYDHGILGWTLVQRAQKQLQTKSCQNSQALNQTHNTVLPYNTSPSFFVVLIFVFEWCASLIMPGLESLYKP